MTAVMLRFGTCPTGTRVSSFRVAMSTTDTEFQAEVGALRVAHVAPGQSSALVEEDRLHARLKRLDVER